LAGGITYALAEIEGNYDPVTRKGFSLVRDKNYITQTRANRIFRYSQASAKMNADGATKKKA